MNLKAILDEAKTRGEKLKNEVVAELLKSRTLSEIVSNKHFITALTRVIQTKDEVKKTLNTQIKAILDVMDVPSKEDILGIAGKLGSLEKIIDKVGRKTIGINILPKFRTKSKPAAVARTSVKPVKAKTKGKSARKK
jgi:hypothetical protein